MLHVRGKQDGCLGSRFLVHIDDILSFHVPPIAPSRACSPHAEWRLGQAAGPVFSWLAPLHAPPLHADASFVSVLCSVCMLPSSFPLLLAVRAGLEPATSALTARRSTD